MSFKFEKIFQNKCTLVRRSIFLAFLIYSRKKKIKNAKKSKTIEPKNGDKRWPRKNVQIERKQKLL